MSREWKVGGTNSNERKSSTLLDQCYMWTTVNVPVNELKIN